MRSYSFLLLLLLLAATGSASAQTLLRYKWKPNTSYRFRCEQKDEVKMGAGGSGSGMPGMPDMGSMMSGMGGMAGNMSFKTSSVFALQISTVNPDGSAKGMFTLESFRVTDGTGRALATLANIPKAALKAPFTVDELGNFDFTQIPILVVDQETGQVTLSIAKVNEGEVASAEAVVDGERVKVYAEFTKSGTLKAGYTVATCGTPKAKTCEVQEDDEVLDLIPTDFLECFVLPEDAVKTGQGIRMAAAGTEQTFKVQKIEGNLATLNTQIGAAMSAARTRQMGDDMAKAAGDEPDTDDEPLPTVAQETQVTITTQFDNGAGMFKGLSGNSATQMNMMGMEVTHSGTFQMTGL